MKVILALFFVVLTAEGVANAAPINNSTTEVPTETVQTVTEVVQETVNVAPTPIPEPVVEPERTHPKGCESYRELYTNIFGSKADVFLKIANKESGCNPMAVGDKHLTYWQSGIQYGMSCGLLQVRYLPGRLSCSEMQDPEANARYALSLYQSGGFRHWSVCNTGKVSCL